MIFLNLRLIPCFGHVLYINLFTSNHPLNFKELNPSWLSWVNFFIVLCNYVDVICAKTQNKLRQKNFHVVVSAEVPNRLVLNQCVHQKLQEL